MRVYAETEVGLPRPIFQVMPRLAALAREVGNFIMRNPGCLEALTCGKVKICDGFFVGDKMRVIARSSRTQFAAESRFIVHFEHIDTHMWRAGCDGLRQREFPVLGGLMRQARG